MAEPLVRWGYKVAHRLRVWARYGVRRSSLGVRVLVLDEADRVLLVRHTYVPGWFMPGGAVDFRERPQAAACREVREETGVRIADPELVGFFGNFARLRSDYIAFYRARVPAQAVNKQPGLEIAEAGFFSQDDLPPGTSAATVARLREQREGRQPSAEWGPRDGL